VVHVIVKALGNFIRIRFLAPYAPGVLGVQERHVILFRKGFYYLHAVVKDARDLKDHRTASQWLGQLLWRDLLVGKKDGRFHPGLKMGCIKGGRGGGVASRGTHSQHIGQFTRVDQRVDIAQGARHAPVLKRGARVLAFVLEIESGPHQLLKVCVGLHHGGVPFAKVKHLSIIKNLAPCFPWDLLQPVKVKVFEEKDAAARRTCIKEATDVIFCPTVQALVDNVTAWLRDQVRLDTFGKFFYFHNNDPYRTFIIDHLSFVNIRYQISDNH
jgi:hypothetical protein